MGLPMDPSTSEPEGVELGVIWPGLYNAMYLSRRRWKNNSGKHRNISLDHIIWLSVSLSWSLCLCLCLCLWLCLSFSFILFLHVCFHLCVFVCLSTCFSQFLFLYWPMTFSGNGNSCTYWDVCILQLVLKPFDWARSPREPPVWNESPHTSMPGMTDSVNISCAADSGASHISHEELLSSPEACSWELCACKIKHFISKWRGLAVTN